jgi:putative transposase
VPRRPRDQTPGHFHITTRGNDGIDVFVTVDDRRVFLALLDRVVHDLEWTLHGWCLMTNHFHLIVETRHENLSPGMQRLNGVYAQWFNAWHSRANHLFGRRFWAKRIEDDAQLQQTATYVLNNPVRAGLCTNPWDWRWLGGPLLVERARTAPFSAP